MSSLTYQCCFCGQGIGESAEQFSSLDPCAIILVGNWQEAASQQVEQQFFCHLACFKSRMWPNVPVEVEELAREHSSAGTADT